LEVGRDADLGRRRDVLGVDAHAAHKDTGARDVGKRVRAFEDKVRAIVDRAACPDAC
jgi:hypothetical protein